jgi:hypothetical protein
MNWKTTGNYKLLPWMNWIIFVSLDSVHGEAYIRICLKSGIHYTKDDYEVLGHVYSFSKSKDLISIVFGDIGCDFANDTVSRKY